MLFSVVLAAEDSSTPPTTAPANRRSALLLTIYSSARFDEFDVAKTMKTGQVPGLAVVQQRRTLDLQEGENNIHLADVATTADFSSLSLRPAAPDAFKVLSQSLAEQLTEPDALLRRAVGHEIIINRKPPALADRVRTPETINAKLLAFDQQQLVVESGNRQLPVQIIPRNSEIAEIKLMADSSAATTRPALSARITSAKGGPQEAVLTYHASGFSWHADYDILLREDQSKVNFASAITILNRSGSSFDDARINLIAAAPGANLNVASRRFAEETGKVVYLLPQPVSLPADAAHRVAFVDAANVGCQMVLACGAADYGRSPALATSYLAIENSSKNGLGRSFPAGRVRVSSQASQTAAPALLADDVLPAIAQGEPILLRLGATSQITVKRELEERRDTDRATFLQTIRITLRNPADQPQRILLIEPRPNSGAQIIDKSDDVQVQSQTMIFTANVPASGEKAISYSVRRPAQ
ncbi:MAG TPA: DUF4139 domain-containing protein [Tepidisphaeraceae bacterium]|nr:DUF4139 domain-containing protein [Tepidisphaeraceae bacterium]